MQSLNEVRFVNINTDRVHGFYTNDLGDDGDKFWQRDIFLGKKIVDPETFRN